MTDSPAPVPLDRTNEEGKIEKAAQRVLEIAVDYGHLNDHGLGAELDDVIEILTGERP
jgi:hypothetical protein